MEYSLRVPMTRKEKASFSRAFKHSGFRTQTEFVRFLVTQYLAVMKGMK